MACINSVPAPEEDAADDRRLWRQGEENYSPNFSSKETWEQLRTHHLMLNWSRVVWFKQGIPRFSFITWLAFQDRLATGARTRDWECIQPCILCGEPDETRDHLFFACPYSFVVWYDLAEFLLGPRVNPDWSITIASLLSPRRKEINTCLLKLILQATIHSIWRERNNRRHQGDPLSPSQMVRFIDKTIRNRISSLRYRKPAYYSDMMQRWLQRTVSS
ncbi:uncharacterized protein LOC108824778 [Raphanus sativus]|uniref:Uncharacterized protein LOC108824778 n=1 Tax=Raphanus sativus TaxID=3726 RepID=A0A6J0L1D4_RAPSA|nr:uncharacterized protein LOC108824778 [Raphanus sativus]